MFKLKKLLCCVIMLSSVISTNIVNATTWDNWRHSDICNRKRDENLKEIVDFYIKIREKCELAEDCEGDKKDIEDYNHIVKENWLYFRWDLRAENEKDKWRDSAWRVIREYCDSRRNVQVKINGENLYFEAYPQFQFKITDIPFDFGADGTFMKMLDKIPQQQPKLKISKRAFLRIFGSFVLQRSLITCPCFVFHLYLNNEKNMNVAEEYRREFWCTTLVYRLRNNWNDWVVCDPYLALNADSIEEGVKYLAIPFEEYKEIWSILGMRWNHNNDDDVKIYKEDPVKFNYDNNRGRYVCNMGGDFSFMSAMSMSFMDDDWDESDD